MNEIDITATNPEKNKTQCRICLGNEIDNPLDPMITPCKCKGSMSYVHLECLRHWINHNIKVIENLNYTIFSWNSLKCELCNSSLPFAICYNNSLYELIKFKIPKKPYIILENSSKKVDSILVLSFSKVNSFDIGRHSTSRIRINEISISRHHSVISWDKGSVYIQDTNSKYGTLILMQKPISLVLGEFFKLQYGKFLMEFAVERISVTTSTYLDDYYKLQFNENICYTEENCLPGNGENGILVMGNYNNGTIKKIERSQTPDTKTIRNVSNKKWRPNRDTFGCRGLKKYTGKLNESIFLIKLQGDTADDIYDNDCH